MRMLRKNIMLCEKYNTKIITTSGALSKWDLRAGRELASIPFLLGFDLGKALDTVSTIPHKLVNTNREKIAGNKFPGVSVVSEGV